MLPKEIGNIILGRPWLFAQNATIQEQPNTYIFRSQDNKITIYSSPAQTIKEKDPICIVGDMLLAYPKINNRIEYPYFVEIIRLYLTILDKYVIFNSYFRKILWHLLGTKLKYSSAYDKSLEKIPLLFV